MIINFTIINIIGAKKIISLISWHEKIMFKSLKNSIYVTDVLIFYTHSILIVIRMDNLYTLLLIISLSSTSVISIREIHFVIAYIVFVVSLFLYPAAYVEIRSNINADSRILNACVYGDKKMSSTSSFFIFTQDVENL